MIKDQFWFRHLFLFRQGIQRVSRHRGVLRRLFAGRSRHGASLRLQHDLFRRRPRQVRQLQRRRRLDWLDGRTGRGLFVVSALCILSSSFLFKLVQCGPLVRSAFCPKKIYLSSGGSAESEESLQQRLRWESWIPLSPSRNLDSSHCPIPVDPPWFYGTCNSHVSDDTCVCITLGPVSGRVIWLRIDVIPYWR